MGSPKCLIWEYAFYELEQLTWAKEENNVLFRKANLNMYTKNMTVDYFKENRKKFKTNAEKFAFENSEYLKNPSAKLFICFLYYMSITINSGGDILNLWLIMKSKISPDIRCEKMLEAVGVLTEDVYFYYIILGRSCCP